ncbi:MAG TPA: hypothetical protein VN721_13220 [Flavipsychrobacter sp.]|nr:hypothetical protein [Flavipsychrobacter sp.]
MRIKVLLIGDNPVGLLPDFTLLKEKNFLVYTCYNELNISEMMQELQPDVIFIDVADPDLFTGIYNDLSSNDTYSNVPIIFTLEEDEIYLVNKKRTVFKENRELLTDNIVSAIKLALRSSKVAHHKDHINTKVQLLNHTFHYAKA